jgi:hypothetical protein
MQLSAKNMRSETIQREFLADAESLKAQIAEFDDFQTVSEADKTRIANSYESLRWRADGTGAKSTRRICKQTRRTGNHMVTRICMTETEWAKLGCARQHDENATQDAGLRKNRGQSLILSTRFLSSSIK